MTHLLALSALASAVLVLLGLNKAMAGPDPLDAIGGAVVTGVLMTSIAASVWYGREVK
jgi:hypothetical protein